METQVLNISDDVRLELRMRNGLFRGLGEASVGSTPLRNPALSIAPLIFTADGVEYSRFQFLAVERVGSGFRIRTRPIAHRFDRLDWTAHDLHARYRTGDWSEEDTTDEAGMLEWRIEHVRETFGSVSYEGFCYSFRWDNPGRVIYQILDRATWEVGGTARGNTFLLRNTFAPPEFTVKSLEDSYSSGWNVGAVDGTRSLNVNPVVFQFLPYYSHLQGFTFQEAHGRMLLTFHKKPSHVRSCFEKPAGKDYCCHYHQFNFDSTDRVETPPACVLLSNQNIADDIECRNHFEEVRQVLHARFRAHYGLMEQRARPCLNVWTWFQFPMERVQRRIFPVVQSWGFKRAGINGLWRSAQTEGTYGNMCCPYELEIASCYGGMAGLRALCDSATEHGLEVMMWTGSSFSCQSPFVMGDRSHPARPDWFCHDVTGHLNRSHYGGVHFVLNYRHPDLAAYWLRKLKAVREEGHLHGIIHDSHFNQGTDTLNHIPGKGVFTQHDALLTLQAELEKMGFCYYTESGGVFGLPGAGLWLKHVYGHEHMFPNYNTPLNPDQVEEAKKLGFGVEDVYFRGLANRLFWMPYWEASDATGGPEPLGNPPPYWSDQLSGFNHAFLAGEPLMGKRRLLPDDQGVLWESDSGAVLFGFRDFAFDCDKSITAGDLIHKQSLSPGRFRAKRHGIYVLNKLA